MYSKIARSRWSLAARLSLWLSLFSMLLVGSVTAFSYFVLVSSFEREDDEFLRDKVSSVVQRLKQALKPVESVSEEWSRSEYASSPLKVEMRLLASNGELLATTPGATAALWPEWQGAVDETVESQVGPWQILTTPIQLNDGADLTLQATLDRREEEEFLSRYRKQLYLVLFVAATASAAGCYWLIRKGLNPLGEFSSLAASVGLHQMNERLDPSQYSVELADVARTFNAMLDRMEQWFGRLNRFSGDIAHELRSPLHNLRGEIEVILQKPRASAEYQDALGSCLEEASRLSQLVDSLLFLARSESPSSALKRERLALCSELGTIQEFYEAAADDAGVSLKTGPTSETLYADRTLFQRAIGNLVTNAIAHTPRGGEITLSVGSRDGEVAVSVTDTGCGIEAKHLPRVFDRLYRVSESRGNQNFGLGLTIVKSVLELHGGSVEIQSVPGTGTTVMTIWPCSE